MSVASIIARGNGLSAGRGMSEGPARVFLPRAARGECRGAAAMSEPDVGSDLGNISCRAKKDGDGWLINGNKYWRAFADGAAIMLVARTSDAPDPKRKHVGLSSFLIEKPRGTLPPGVKGSPIPKIGYFGWKTWELAFDNCRLPAEALIGEEGKAFYYISAGLERARAHTAARAIGLARGALEDATAYAQERRQFGQAIGDFQNTRFRLARMATDIEASRQLMYFVCDEIDQKRRCDKEAAMVKFHASEMAERVTSDALQIFGGAGYTTLHAVERYWRDAGADEDLRRHERDPAAHYFRSFVGKRSHDPSVVEDDDTSHLNGRSTPPDPAGRCQRLTLTEGSEAWRHHDRRR